jgi:hypothetical protein
MAVIVTFDKEGIATGWFDPEASSSGWFDQELADSGDGSASISGAVLEGSDVVAGTVTLEVKISGAVTEASDVVAGTIGLAISISGAVLEASDAVAGTIGLAVSINGIVLEDSDAVSGTLEVIAATDVNISGDVLEGSDLVEGRIESERIFMGGAGHPVYYQGKRKKRKLEDQPNKHLQWILDRTIAEYYSEIIEADVPKSVKQEVGEVVRPYIERKAKGIPQRSNIDWQALQQNADAVGTILQIWNEELRANDLEEDDEEFLIMH